jgi:hypothetical protein
MQNYKNKEDREKIVSLSARRNVHVVCRHKDESLITRVIEERGMLSYVGDGKMRTYSLSKRYESQIALITKAVEIGLNEISRQAKDQNNGQ